MLQLNNHCNCVLVLVLVLVLSRGGPRRPDQASYDHLNSSYRAAARLALGSTLGRWGARESPRNVGGIFPPTPNQTHSQMTTPGMLVDPRSAVRDMLDLPRLRSTLCSREKANCPSSTRPL